MSFSVDVLAGIAIELQSGIGHQDRFQRLITTLRAMRRRCCAMRGGSLFRWRSTVWRRMYWAGALLWKGIRDWKPLPVPGMWCVFRPTATCRTRMTG